MSAEPGTRTTSKRLRTVAEPGTLRELLHVALPLMASSGSQSMMLVVDRIFLTWYSVDAVAASLPAGIFFWAVQALPFGTAVYTNTFVAQYTGAGRKDRVAASIWQGCYFALGCGLLLMLCAPAAPWLLGWTGHSGPVARMEIECFAILCLGGVPGLLSVVLSSFFGGRGRTVVVMCVYFVACLINAVLDYLFVFGIGPFPEMGIRGSAWATVISHVVSCLLFGALLVGAARTEGYRLWRMWRFDRDLMRRMLRYGLPTGVQFLVDIGAFLLFVMLVGRLGTTELAATTIAFNLNSMAFIPMYGLGTAVLTLVGRRIGEGRPDDAARTTRLSFWLASLYMGVFALLYVAVPDLLLAPYATRADPAEFAAIRPIVVILLRFVALYSFFDAMASVFGSAIRGAGDSTFSLWWTFFTSWLLMVAPTWLAVRYGAGGIIAGWTAASVYITVLGLGFLLRYRTGRWRSMSVIEKDVEPLPSARS